MSRAAVTTIAAFAFLFGGARDAYAREEPEEAPPAVDKRLQDDLESAEPDWMATPPDEDMRREAGDNARPAGEREEREPPWETIADAVVGGTNTTAAAESKPGASSANVLDRTRVTSYTLLTGLERHVGERGVVGARIPFVYGTLRSRTGAADARSVSTLGNAELEGAYTLVEGGSVRVVVALEVALPVMGAGETPTAEEVAADPERQASYAKLDRIVALQAGSAARGSYESALFEPGNLGFVPKVSATFNLSGFTISPMLKVENMVALNGGSEEIYINELVAGVRAGYRMHPNIEPGVHVWARELHEHGRKDDANDGIAVVEPYARFLFGWLKPTASVIVPFAGNLAHERTFGARASVAAFF
jgi:hypothetical protein